MAEQRAKTPRLPASEEYEPIITSERTGLQWPGRLEANRRWRIATYQACYYSEALQKQWLAASKADLQTWFGAFYWAYNADSKRVDPFVPWRAQRELIDLIRGAVVAPHDLLTEKSRKMGATWIHLGVLLWHWLFRDDHAFMVMSEQEALVDKPDDPDALFWKLDYSIGHLPAWMRPPVRQKVHRTHMHLLNPKTRSVIDGRATTGTAGRGGRRAAIFVDEAAAIPELDGVLAATADNTGCRLFASTAQGQNAFWRLRVSGKIKVVSMFWWRHPDKGSEAYYDQDGKLTSPWRDAEIARRSSKREVAQEIDGDYMGAGEMFFEQEGLKRAERDDVRPPGATGELLWMFDHASSHLDVVGFKESHGKARLSLWTELDVEGLPPRDDNYVLGVDVSNGEGSSNSVISVGSVNHKRLVAQFADPHCTPEDLARHAVALGKWFGGHAGQSYMIWEANGPGGIFGREVMMLGYHYVYYQRDEQQVFPKRGKRPGWHSSRTSKELLLSNYRRALNRGDFINACTQSILECWGYVYLQKGGIGPGKMADLTTGARSTHGDRVIADALCVLGTEDEPAAQKPPPDVEYGSFAYRRKLARLRRARESLLAD